jgi:hypothetical protein
MDLGEKITDHQDNLIVGSMGTSPHSPGVQAMPYGSSTPCEAKFNCFFPPCSLIDFLPLLYNQLSNEQGKGVENLFT